MKYLLILTFLVILTSCTAYKKACNKFLKPKVELLAETIAIKCQCPSANIHKVFNPISKKICLQAKGEIQEMLNDSSRDGTPLTGLVCHLAKDVVIKIAGKYLSNKLECKISFDKCLPLDSLKQLIDDKICSAL